MRLILAFWLLRRFNRRRRTRITIEPYPHHIHAVFERSGPELATPYDLPRTPWSWPTSTWMQRRISAVRKG